MFFENFPSDFGKTVSISLNEVKLMNSHRSRYAMNINSRLLILGRITHVCLLVTNVSPTKTAEPIEMAFVCGLEWPEEPCEVKAWTSRGN